MQTDVIHTKRKAEADLNEDRTHKRKLPCYMTMEDGGKMTESRILPDEILEKVAAIVATRQELEEEAGEDEKHRLFLEDEVLSILDIVDKSYQTDEEAKRIFSQLRSAARMVHVGIGAMLEGKTLEQVRYNMSNTRWSVLDDMQTAAYDLAGVYWDDY